MRHHRLPMGTADPGTISEKTDKNHETPSQLQMQPRNEEPQETRPWGAWLSNPTVILLQLIQRFSTSCDVMRLWLVPQPGGRARTLGLMGAAGEGVCPGPSQAESPACADAGAREGGTECEAHRQNSGI